MIRTLSKAALAMALAGTSVQAQAACNRPSFGSDAVDPVKAMVKWGLGRSADVFVGTVTAMDYVPANSDFGPGEMLVIRMAAGRRWKGGGGAEVTLLTENFAYADGGSSTESHEYRYELGKTYLVYAHTYREGLHANTCTLTKPIDAAADDIAALDALNAE